MGVLPTLRQCLINAELTRLRVIARFWGLEVKASRPLAIATELARYLADPVYAADTWTALSDDERAALTALLEAGGTMPAAAFERHFGGIRPIGPGRMEREATWRRPAGPAEALWYRGVIFSGFAEEGNKTFPIVFVPEELKAALPARVAVQVASIQVEPAAPPVHARIGGGKLLDDVTTVLSFVHNEVVRPPGHVPALWQPETKSALSRHLRDPDFERLNFVLHMVNDLGWVRIGEDGRLRLVSEPVLAWLSESVVESLEILVSAWRCMGDWDELSRLTTLEPDETGTWHSDPTLGRATLVRHLEALPLGEWVRIADFVQAIKENDPDFQRPGGDYEAWYVRDATGAYLTGFEMWDQVEGALLRALLEGPAWWLGVVDLGADGEDESPQVFRVRARPASDLIPDQPQTVVRSDLTITMPGGRRFERFQLARVADPVRVDQRYVYRLTPTSLHRAQQQHIDSQKVLSFLDGLSDAPLPKAVRLCITRWAERGTEVWLERTLLLRVTDETVMQRIKASPRTSRFIARVISPTVAVVAEENWPGLAAGLAELGLLAELLNIGDDEFGI